MRNEQADTLLDALDRAGSHEARRKVLHAIKDTIQSQADRIDVLTEASKTPRTDAKELVIGPRFEWSDFARTLERELSEASARIATLEAALQGMLKRYRAPVNSGDCGHWEGL